MRFKRQILILLVYCIFLVLAYFMGVNFHLDQAMRVPIAQVYYITSLILGFLFSFEILNNFTNLYVEGLKKNLSIQYPQLDPSEFDFHKFEEEKDKKSFDIIQPITCIIACTPYLFYVFLRHYELRIIFGVLANISLVICIEPIMIRTYINRFLFMRKLDQLLEPT